MIGLEYKDTIEIYEITSDGYGDEEGVPHTVPALFLVGTGTNRSFNVDNIIADAHAYVDPKNEFLISKAYRIEGLLIKANPFGGADSEAWYRITMARVGQDKLLTNQIDNVHIYLQKARGL